MIRPTALRRKAASHSPHARGILRRTLWTERADDGVLAATLTSRVGSFSAGRTLQIVCWAHTPAARAAIASAKPVPGSAHHMLSAPVVPCLTLSTTRRTCAWTSCAATRVCHLQEFDGLGQALLLLMDERPALLQSPDGHAIHQQHNRRLGDLMATGDRGAWYANTRSPPISSPSNRNIHHFGPRCVCMHGALPVPPLPSPTPQDQAEKPGQHVVYISAETEQIAPTKRLLRKGVCRSSYTHM
jgi:hypothetical protein